MTELDNDTVEKLLKESGVANDLSHYENGKLHTAITSINELKLLITKTYCIGYENGFDEAIRY